MVGACFREDEHDARILYSMSIQYSHFANGHRLAGPIGLMPDLKLPLLAPLMAISKHPEDSICHVNPWWREDSCWVI
jgi:hypothetical protein